MRSMGRGIGGAAILAVVMAIGPASMSAQGPPHWRDSGGAFGRGGRMEAGAGVEMILRLRDDLALTEGQVQQLDAMRQELVERRTAARSEVEELQSQARAGALTREELREQMQARRDAAVGGLDEQRERIEGVLTEAQRAQLQELRESRGPRQGRRGGGPDGVRPRRPGRPPAPGR